MLKNDNIYVSCAIKTIKVKIFVSTQCKIKYLTTFKQIFIFVGVFYYFPRIKYFFKTVAPPKKNLKLPSSYARRLRKHRNIIERYFLRLKCFGKVFPRYNKLDSILISTISLDFIFDLLFM